MQGFLSSEACIMDSGTYFVIEFTAALVKRESKWIRVWRKDCGGVLLVSPWVLIIQCYKLQTANGYCNSDGGCDDGAF